jgi:hypothetical protein
MLTANQLIKLAEELENPDNEALISVEHDDVLLDKVAASFIKAADALRNVAEDMAALEPTPEAFTPEKLDEIAAIAEAFSDSDDELLQKQASVLDDLLITLAAPQNAYRMAKQAGEDRIEQLKKKYKDTLETQHKMNRITEAVEAVKNSPVYKEYRPLESSLSTRTCPNHFGVSLYRIGENTMKCPLGGEEISWEEGFTTERGNKVPGVSVQEQHMNDGHNTFSTFNNREERMSGQKD